MKVRWSRDSVRLRITPSELARVANREEVEECLKIIGGTRWQIFLRSGTQTGLTSEDGSLLVSLSAQDAERLAALDAEGVYFTTPEGIRYYVEKDFPCAHPRVAEALEPVTETFEAPEGFEDRKSETETHDA